MYVCLSSSLSFASSTLRRSFDATRETKVSGNEKTQMACSILYKFDDLDTVCTKCEDTYLRRFMARQNQIHQFLFVHHDGPLLSYAATECKDSIALMVTNHTFHWNKY